MEDFNEEHKRMWQQKVEQNTALVFEKFKSKVEAEGGKMELLAKFGDQEPKIYISGKISDALQKEINDFVSQFAPSNLWG